MTYIAKPKFHHPGLQKNELGFTRRDYEGKISTLCAGCGHDSITAAIIEACFELSIAPHRVAKISGIGCSSKTPDYFLGNSHGFNSVHGRMPSVLTGANRGWSIRPPLPARVNQVLYREKQRCLRPPQGQVLRAGRPRSKSKKGVV